MTPSGQRQRKMATLAVGFSLIVCGLLYLAPLVRFLVWLNAGAISAWFHSPKSFLYVALSEGLLAVTVLASLIYLILQNLWTSTQKWADKVHREVRARKKGER
jgi:hypothetical protein